MKYLRFNKLRPSIPTPRAYLPNTSNEYLSPISNLVAGTVFYSVNLGDFSFPLIVVWLIVAALYCTFYFRFINIKGFGTALSFLTSKKNEKDF